MKKFLEKIPFLPLSALVFYLTVLFLWKIGIIPPPEGILVLLESLYEHYGLIGLFISAFLEGVVYLGLYFPGSFIIALSVILSDGTIISFFMISLVVTVALTLTSVINYMLGRYVVYKEKKEKINSKRKISSKGFWLSMIHPNLLAFYFFHSGIKQQSPRKILLVPAFIIYGFMYAGIIYSTKEWFKKAIESPGLMITLITIWIIVSFVINSQHKRADLNNSLN